MLYNNGFDLHVILNYFINSEMLLKTELSCFVKLEAHQSE